MTTVTTLLLGASAVLLGVSAIMVVGRMARGPTMLDRAISFDVLVAITICGIALDAALSRDSDNLSLLLIATLLGFVGSVSIARFSPGSDDVDAEEADARAEDPR
jgi:multicomponent Na+:H+ antiporter subunit F